VDTNATATAAATAAAAGWKIDPLKTTQDVRRKIRGGRRTMCSSTVYGEIDQRRRPLVLHENLISSLPGARQAILHWPVSHTSPSPLYSHVTTEVPSISLFLLHYIYALLPTHPRACSSWSRQFSCEGPQH
jgi:hypothetical protein